MEQATEKLNASIVEEKALLEREKAKLETEKKQLEKEGIAYTVVDWQSEFESYLSKKELKNYTKSKEKKDKK